METRYIAQHTSVCIPLISPQQDVSLTKQFKPVNEELWLHQCRHFLYLYVYAHARKVLSNEE